MLCTICQKIRLGLDVPSDQTTAKQVKIRRWETFTELRAQAEQCEFCALAFEPVKHLDGPDGASYCKAKWGDRIYYEAVHQSTVWATHEALNDGHNITISFVAEASKVPGFEHGPTALTGEYRLGGVFVTSGSSLANLVSGRAFDRTASKPHMSQLAHSWFQQCRSGHQQCAPPRLDFVPSRLIRIEPGKGQPIARLTHPSQSFDEDYIALSYRWGMEEFFTLNSGTLEFLSKGVPMNTLPQSIQDALEVCLILETPHLWVDSLCILQDSRDDWLKESASMGKLFANAALTIRAGAGTHSRHGLFADRHWMSSSTASLTGVTLDGKEAACSVRGSLQARADPIDSRGWALQEVLLPTRVVTFGEAEMSWTCKTLYHQESGNKLTMIPHSGSLLPRPMWVPKVDSTERFLMDVPAGVDHRSDVEFNVWKWIVFSYASRDLSLSKDKLPAIAGLAWWLVQASTLLEEKDYLAGLWRPHLPTGLLWMHRLPLETNARSPPAYRAPSWSWASLDCDYLDWCKASAGEPVAQVRDAVVSSRVENVFGEVIDGHLDLHAPIKTGWLVPTRTHHEISNFWDDDWREQLKHDISPAREEELVLGRVWMDRYHDEDLKLRIVDRVTAARTGVCLRITSEYGMLVEILPENEVRDGDARSPPLYRRLGIVEFHSGRADQWWQGARWETVRLK